MDITEPLTKLLIFVANNPQVAPIIEEVQYKLLRVFPDAKFWLEHSNMQHPDSTEHLIIHVNSKVGYDEATEKFRMFDQLYWCDKFCEAGGAINVMLAFD